MAYYAFTTPVLPGKIEAWKSYVAEMKAFVDAVVNDKPSPVGGIEGRIPVVMGLAAWKSYHENRPVRLSEIG